MKIPPDVRKERFNAGLGGGRLDELEYFQYSFRVGFRTGQRYLQRFRRSRGLIDFPFLGRIKVRALWR
ncbi:MAG: hypothetical protein ACT4NU_03220 [Chromatiales bacterium]